MGLNLSRGDPIKYYSSDRIAQIVGNGLLNLIDEKTLYRDFFSDKEMIFYKNIDDLADKILKYKNDDKERKRLLLKKERLNIQNILIQILLRIYIRKNFS